MATATHFWQFTFIGDKSNINNVPEIVPGSPPVPNLNGTPDGRGSNDNVKPYTSGAPTKSSIDVVNDFPWTKDGPGARVRVPRIVLKEKKIQTSPYITNLINSALDAVASTSSVAERADGLAVSLYETNTSSSVVNGAATGAAVGIEMAAMGVQAAISSLAKSLKGAGSAYDAPASEFLKTYQGMYILKPTGFVYTFPLGAEALSMGNSNIFGDAKDDAPKGTGAMKNPLSLLSGIKTGIDMAAEGMGKIDAFLQPGSYFEKAKFFDMPSDGESWPIDFTLSNIGDANTSSEDVIMKNFNLIFLLLYQNTPGRRSRSLVDPPAMYEVIIDGVNYAPYAVIKDITITPLGRIITKTLPFPQLKNVRSERFGSISTAVPEAYRIRITVQSLHAKTKNFILAGLEGSNLGEGSINVSDILKK